MEKTVIKLLKDLEITLNNIPNHKNVGPNGESSYDMVSRLSKFIK
jgi:hypothetical protein